jgi:hypothetical protein
MDEGYTFVIESFIGQWTARYWSRDAAELFWDLDFTLPLLSVLLEHKIDFTFSWNIEQSTTGLDVYRHTLMLRIPDHRDAVLYKLLTAS